MEEYFACVMPIKNRGQNLGFGQYNCETPCDQIDYIAWQDMNELSSNIFPKLTDTERLEDLDLEDEDDDDMETEDRNKVVVIRLMARIRIIV